MLSKLETISQGKVMYYYFHIQFEDKNADIYIVRVKKSDRWLSMQDAKRIARSMITKELTGVKEFDFNINNITLESFLLQCVFIKDIAQLTAVKHP